MADSILSPPFATTSDLEARWRTLTTAEKSQAGALITDASDIIVTTCPRYADASAATLTRITCAMVKRAMVSGDDAELGVSSSQQTAGPFNQSFQFANPLGDLYLTKAEKRQLGCGVQRAFSIDMTDGSVTVGGASS